MQQIDGDGVLLVRYKVAPDSVKDFQIWKAKTDEVMKTFKGFIAITLLNPEKDSDYYYVIIRFNSSENARVWLNSDARKNLLKDPHATWLSDKQEVIQDWDKFWYNTFSEVKKWKQWVVTFIAVYPLTIVVPRFVKTISAVISLSFFEGIINALLISGLMIFLVMPLVLSFFKKWLRT